ncbi:MAG TPA: serine hydrolase domain-containing protein, partial [Terriglobia bacterium]|nr:serine hydrolase domain-containing protein [Terriglobia bacterium]
MRPSLVLPAARLPHAGIESPQQIPYTLTSTSLYRSVSMAYTIRCVALFLSLLLLLRTNLLSTYFVAASSGAEPRTQVDRVFAVWDKPDSPGCALGIVQNGKLIYQKGYGRANLEHDVPITPSTVFYIASTSKQFTAASIALLARQDKLSLDDNVRKYIPELPVYEYPVTIRHLIYHTSGIPDYLELLGLAGQRLDDVHSEEEVLDLLSRQKSLSFQPGEQFLYSNSGYFLLAVIVKRVSGKSFAQFAEEQIFQPLGMTHSRFHDSRTRLVKNRAQGYFSGREGEFRNYLSQFDRVGDGGLMTTVEDLFRWDQAVENGTVGGEDFAVSLLAQGHLNNGRLLSYGFGLMIGQQAGLKTVSHGGSFIGFKSELLRIPERHLSVICLCNHNAADASKLAKEVANIVLGNNPSQAASATAVSAIQPVEHIPLTESELKSGSVFREPTTGSLWRFSTEEGKTVATVDGQRFQLKSVGKDRYRSLDAPIDLELEFQRPSQDRPLVLQLGVEGQSPIALEAIELASPTLNQLGEFAGNYYSAELQALYQVFLHEG